MGLIATLLVRDEADIVAECLTYYLNAGVDEIIVTDNNSTDGTRDILAQFGKALRIIDEPSPEYNQSFWVTRMARLACELKADWVLHTDADEFWVGFNDLRLIPPEVSVLKARRSFFHIPVRDGDFTGPVRERLPYCVASDFTHPRLCAFERYDIGEKVMHRAEPNIVVAQGCHFVVHSRGRLSTSSAIVWHHYPIRSPQQFDRKVKNTQGQGGSHWRVWHEIYLAGMLDKVYYLVSYPREELEALYRDDIIEIG